MNIFKDIIELFKILRNHDKEQNLKRIEIINYYNKDDGIDKFLRIGIDAVNYYDLEKCIDGEIEVIGNRIRFSNKDKKITLKLKKIFALEYFVDNGE